MAGDNEGLARTLLKWLFGFLVDQVAKPDVRGPSVGFHAEIGATGYSVAAEKRQRLLALCEEVVSLSQFISRDITCDGNPETFCNQANAHVAQGMSCWRMRAELSANEQCRLADDDQEFHKGTAEEAAKHALAGGYGFAGLALAGHGHVAPIWPQDLGTSGAWGRVPYVAHVGEPPNEKRLLSYAFKIGGQKPTLYLYRYRGGA